MELAEAIKSWKEMNSLEIFFIILDLSWYELITFVVSEMWKFYPVPVHRRSETCSDKKNTS